MNYRLSYTTISSILIIVMFGICLSISSFTCNDELIYFLGFISSIVYVFFLYATYKKRTEFFLFNLFIIFNFIWFACSVGLLELGAYTPELELFGEPTGALPRYILSSMLFIAFATFGFEILKIKGPLIEIKKMTVISFFIFYIVSLVMLFLIYVVYGSALGAHVDRIYFRNEVAPSGYFQLITIMTLLSYPLGLIRIQMIKYKKIIDIVFYFFVIALILGGEKFSLIIMALLLYRFSHVQDNLLRRERIIKLIPVASFLCILVVCLSFIQYKNIINVSNNNAPSPFKLLLDRVAQQAQLNYFFDKYIFVDGHENDGDMWFERELLGDQGTKRGIDLLMSVSTPYEIYSSYESAGVTFGDGFPAILFYYFSWLAYIVIIPLGVIFGLMSGLCMRALYSGRILENILLMFLLYNTLLSIFLNGELYLMVDLSTSKWLCLLLISILWGLRVFGPYKKVKNLGGV